MICTNRNAVTSSGKISDILLSTVFTHHCNMPPKKTTAVWAKQANDEGLAKLSSFFKAVPKQGEAETGPAQA